MKRFNKMLTEIPSVVQLDYSKQKQNIETKVMYTHRLSLPKKLGLEFELYGDNLLLFRSVDGEIYMNNPDEIAKMYLDVHSKAGNEMLRKALEENKLPYGIRTENITIKLFREDGIEICDTSFTKIPLIIYSWNIWNESIQEPFGAICNWRFIY